MARPACRFPRGRAIQRLERRGFRRKPARLAARDGRGGVVLGDGSRGVERRGGAERARDRQQLRQTPLLLGDLRARARARGSRRVERGLLVFEQDALRRDLRGNRPPGRDIHKFEAARSGRTSNFAEISTGRSEHHAHSTLRRNTSRSGISQI